MAALIRKTVTRPLPADAVVVIKDGVPHATWRDRRSRKQSAPLVVDDHGQPLLDDHGRQRIRTKSATIYAKLRIDGAVREIPTGCRTEDAARIKLAEFVRRAEQISAGVLTAAQAGAVDFQHTPVQTHLEAYLSFLSAKRGKGAKLRVSPRHVVNVRHCLTRVMNELGFKCLKDLNRDAVQRWAERTESEGLSARTVNAHLAALTAFGAWCLDAKRLLSNPFVRMNKRDEHAGRRRERRALTEGELRRLLEIARLRPIAECGRSKVRRDSATRRADDRTRRTWRRAPLTPETIAVAVERGRKALAGRPDHVTELERRGLERSLIYKTLVLTGLRKSELASLTIGQLELDGPVAFAVLKPADEKAGRGAEIPLRADLVTDLRAWLAMRLEAARTAAKVQGAPLPARLPQDSQLFQVSADLVRAFDRDLRAAGIAKRDDRGRVLDIHALRHTFGTHLSKAGVAPRTAQAALRHSSLALTMNVYTDPRLLDVAGALRGLPTLPIIDTPTPERIRATGTDSVAPMVAPAVGNSWQSRSFADETAVDPSQGEISISGDGVTNCASLSSHVVKRANGLEPSTFSLEG